MRISDGLGVEWTSLSITHWRDSLSFAYRRYEVSGLLTPHRGSMEKHSASVMIGLMDEWKLSVEGLKGVSGGVTTDADAEKKIIAATNGVSIVIRKNVREIAVRRSIRSEFDAELTLGYHQLGLRRIEPAVAQIALGRAERRITLVRYYSYYTLNFSFFPSKLANSIALLAEQ